MFHNSDGIVLLYSITEAKSFDRIKNWIKEIHNTALEDIITVLVGHKSDLEDKRKIQTSMGTQCALENKMCFNEASSKTNENVEKIFNEIIDLIIEKKKNKKETTKAEIIDLSKKREEKKEQKGCCLVKS